MGCGVACVHARQIAREQRRFVAARARSNLHKSGPGVVRILGQQHALQLGFERGQLRLGRCDLLRRHVGHVGVLQQVLRGGHVLLTLLKARPTIGHGRHLRVLARQLHELRHVGHDVRAGQQEVQLHQAGGVAVELMS